MPNRLNLPTELEALIEKRELESRRQSDREPAASNEKENHIDLSPNERESAPSQAAAIPVERRKKPGRRPEDLRD